LDERDEQQYIEISGTVKNVVFQNEENGYTVLRLDVGGEEPMTVVGCLPFAASGEGLTALGSWERHPSHGTQFKAVSAQRRLPVGERAIYAYLASGAVKGIGAATATLMVDKFGSRTLEVLSEAPEKLTPLVAAVNELSEEEPRLGFVWESSTRELSINVSGEVQIEIISALLSERFNLKPHISPPSVIYRETPTRAGIGYEAYTMPKPCWAIVQFKFEPLPRGSGVVYDEVERLPVDQLHPKYRAHIKTSFYDSLKQGIKGWEVTDFKATLTGGEHHLEHTHPLDFFVATPVAFLNGLVNCGTTYLEPMLLCRISIPEEHLGKVLGDIVGMRGEFDTPVITSGAASIECKLPVASSFDYPVKLASLSGGKARFYSRFDSWRDCPDELAQPTPYRGVCPLDRARWILYARGAYQLKQ